MTVFTIFIYLLVWVILFRLFESLFGGLDSLIITSLWPVIVPLFLLLLVITHMVSMIRHVFELEDKIK